MMSRADKRRKISPYVPQFIRAYVHDVAKHVGKSDGEAGALLVMAAISDFPTLNRLAPYMWRDYAFGTHAWIGHREHQPLDSVINPPGHMMDRLSMRFALNDWASIDALGFAFGRPVSHAAAALLRFAHDTPRVTQIIAEDYIPRSPYSLQRGLYGWGSGRTS